ncbi:competence protein CoiA [Deinococcus aquaedulcis]|uniref:competence protein CoiA n=1 Tax=Deinococcus aquaedulcis TaxID=2840455 RepID=UPI001C82D985|nr:hypothetical protein [Deinococcus aquaedulcis]
MPLRALLDGADLNAWNQETETWATLKQTYRQRQLRTVCCDQPAVPKTSSLGTFFFAHRQRGDCTSASETPEHLLAKSVIAQAAQDAGWHVVTECRGVTPEGEVWIADVLVQKGDHRIAFEVQWSPQTLADTVARQARYKQSGVRGLWLKRRRARERVPFEDETYDQDATPIFGLQHDESHFSVQPFDVPLRDFVQGALSRQLLYWPRGVQSARLGVTTTALTCWRCKRETNVIIDVHLAHPRHPEIYLLRNWDEGGMWSGESPVKQLLADVFTAERRRMLHLGAIKPRASKTVRQTYLSQGCAHCDALQGDFFIMEAQHEAYADGSARPPQQWWPVRFDFSTVGGAEWHFMSRPAT